MSGIRDLARARSELRRHLADTGHRDPDGEGLDLDEAAERLLLAADEMASNGVRHGRLPVTLTVTHHLETGCYLLTVTDRAPRAAPTPDPDRDPALGGHGLRIITTYALDHGWWPTADDKTVWAQLPTA